LGRRDERDVGGDLRRRRVADAGPVVLELARPGLRDRDRYSDGGHLRNPTEPDRGPDRPRERIDRVSDTFRAAQARSDAIEEQMAKDPASLRMLTGDRPTGALHIGHYFGSIRNRLKLQSEGGEIIQLIAAYQVISGREVGGG